MVQGTSGNTQGLSSLKDYLGFNLWVWSANWFASCVAGYGWPYLSVIFQISLEYNAVLVDLKASWR